MIGSRLPVCPSSRPTRGVSLSRCALRIALILGAVCSLAIPPRAWAQNPPCPPPPVTIQMVRPSANAVNLGGTVRVDLTNTPAPAGYVWYGVWVDVYDSGNVLRERGQATRIDATTCYYNCVTSLHPNASWTLKAWGTLIFQATGLPCDVPMTPPTPITTVNPTIDRHAPKTELDCSCRRDGVCTGSSTSPLTGAQSFTIPVSSWDSHGATFGFSLTYQSHTLNDPQAVSEPDFRGLSEVNDHWSHPFAQWVSLYSDETGTEYAVWHQGGSVLSFPRSSPNTGSPFTSLAPGYTILYGGAATTDPFNCNGLTNQRVTIEYGWFKIIDPDRTEYDFDFNPPTLNGHLYWRTAECAAYPDYLLTRIVDRWGRTLTVNWTSVNVRGVMEPRVASVQDDSGNGVTLNTPAPGLLTSVTDPQGRAHTLSYTQVPSESGQGYYKLTGVHVLGAGLPNRVNYNWSFAYRDATNPDLAYGGVAGDYTGDLVIQKTDPLGVATNYQYGPVAIMGAAKTRPRPTDWDGAVQQISWTDNDPATDTGSTARTITRALNPDHPSQAILTFPSPPGDPVSVAYDYAGGDVTAVTDLSTNRTWHYTYDTTAPTAAGFHNLTSVSSPKEAGGSPLVQYSYTYSGDQVTQVIEQVRQSDGSLGAPVTTHFNTFNLPDMITATGRMDLGHPNQVTEFHYDNDAPLFLGSPANLTKIVEASGQTEAQTTQFTYTGTAGSWGLPNSVINAVGGMSNFTYDTTPAAPSGRLLTASSPTNDLLPAGDADIPASTTTLAYNSDGLPQFVYDPKQDWVSVSYNAVSPGSSSLVVTLTYPPYSNTRQFIVDARGRVIQDKDEAGIYTVWTYNNQDQVLTVKRDAFGPAPRLTRFYYTSKGDLDHFDPPSGAAGGVYFGYNRYKQDGTPDSPFAYEGQVTRISYPGTPAPDNQPATAEYFGYDPLTGELAWRRKADGGLITITPDELHRIASIHYPTSQGNGDFFVMATYDEFGRVATTSDQTGMTTLTYDSLNRLTKVVPPSPQREVDYAYMVDNDNQMPQPLMPRHRWRTQVMVSGVGSVPYEYQEDNKGRLYKLISPFNQTTTLHYDRDGKNIEADLPNGVTEFRTYLEPQDWLSTLQIHQPNGANLDLYNYYYTDALGNYDPTGHLLREVDKNQATHAFVYNRFYELTREIYPLDLGMPGTLDYTYDSNGNRTSRTLNGTVVDNYHNDNNNKLLWVNRGSTSPPTSQQTSPYMLFGYDLNGNTTRRERRYDNGILRLYDLFWDGDDNLRQTNQAGALGFAATYNGDGLRVTKSDFWTAPHTYTWGLGGVLYDSSSNTTYTPGVSQNVNGTDSFFHTDWLGSTRYLTNNTGNTATAAPRYTAFGERSNAREAQWPSDYQFAGDWGYQTEWAASYEPGTALQYLENRYYDPAVGRFISQDPISFDGGWNLYEYSENDPANGVDPDGLQFRGAPDPFDYEGSSESFSSDPRNRPYREEASRIGGRLRGGVEFAGSFNEVTNVGLAANDLKERRYASATLRLVGPLSKLLGWGRGFFQFKNRPGFARLPGGGNLPRWLVSPISGDWATKGAHIRVNGVELAVRPGCGGTVLLTGSPFSTTSRKVVEQAIREGQPLLRDRTFLTTLLDRVAKAKAHVLQYPNDGGLGRSAELHFLEAALKRALGQ